MGGKSSPKAPDYSEVAASQKHAADLQYKTGQEQLEWAREMWGEQSTLLNKVMDQQMGIAGEQWENAKKDRARYEEKFQPIEDNLIKEFQEYDSPERQAQAAGRAQASVQQSLDAQRENAQANLEAYGIDPSQTRSQAMDNSARVKAAAMQAGAGNQERQRVENVGRALRAESINIGKGLPSQVAGSYGGSLNASNSAMGNMNSTVNSGANSMGTNTQYQGLGNASTQAQANTMNMGFQNELSAYNAGGGALGGLGQLGGMAMGAYLGGMEDGGEVPSPEAAPAGGLPPAGPTDTVPAMLAPGEYIVPAAVVKAKGTDFFDKLSEKYNGALPLGAEGAPA
jgi:hypothetical protein